jgi:hypothetical protein
MFRGVQLRLVLGAIALVGLSVVAANAAPASAAPRIELTEVNCLPGPTHEGKLDIVRLHNRGDASQDLTGWQLKSDPEDSQSFSLNIAGTLPPVSETIDPDPKYHRPWVVIVAGQHATELPHEQTWLWSSSEILRDPPKPDDPVQTLDFIRLYDSSGNLVDSQDCAGNPVPLQTSTPETPTPAPQVANTDTPAEGTQGGAQTGSSGSSGTNTGATTGQPAGSGQTAAQAGLGGSVPAPNSGVGSLAPVTTSPLRLALGLVALGAGFIGLVLGGNPLRKRGTAVSWDSSRRER